MGDFVSHWVHSVKTHGPPEARAACGNTKSQSSIGKNLRVLLRNPFSLYFVPLRKRRRCGHDNSLRSCTVKSWAENVSNAGLLLGAPVMTEARSFRFLKVHL